MPSVDDLVVCLGDFNGHVVRHNDGFGVVDGGYGFFEMKMKMKCLFHSLFYP